MKELESNFIDDRQRGDKCREVPEYLIEYMIKYYIKDINKAAAKFIEYCDYTDDAKYLRSSWLREFCVAGSNMTILRDDKNIDI
jgi:hypothetical protein